MSSDSNSHDDLSADYSNVNVQNRIAFLEGLGVIDHYYVIVPLIIVMAYQPVK